MKKYIYFCLLVLLLGVTGCKKAPDFGDAVYMTGTLQSSNIRFLVDGQSSMGLTVTSTNKTGADVRIGLKEAPELLADFNASTGRNCVLPPEGSYTIEGTEVVINSGKTRSTQIKISADSELLQEGEKQAVLLDGK